MSLENNSRIASEAISFVLLFFIFLFLIFVSIVLRKFLLMGLVLSYEVKFSWFWDRGGQCCPARTTLALKHFLVTLEKSRFKLTKATVQRCVHVCESSFFILHQDFLHPALPATVPSGWTTCTSAVASNPPSFNESFLLFFFFVLLIPFLLSSEILLLIVSTECANCKKKCHRHIVLFLSVQVCQEEQHSPKAVKSLE